MAYAVELFYDPGLESRVRRICAPLRELETGGLVLTDDPKARPHLTLVVFDDADLAELEVCVRRAALETRSFPVALSAVGVFPAAECVVFLAPVVSEEILAAHRTLQDLLPRFTDSAWPLYTPARWVPHTTLINRVPRENVPRVIELAAESTFPISGEVTEIGVSEFSEGRVERMLFTAPLQ
jgi:2'-5' RNA ligase